MQVFITIVSVHKPIKKIKMKKTNEKKDGKTATPQEALKGIAIKRAKENFPAPNYPGQFIDRETRVSIAIKKNPFTKGKETTADDGGLRPPEKAVLIIDIYLFKAPAYLVALLEKKEGFGALTSEQAQELWKVRKDYHYGYETTVDKTYADLVVTEVTVRND